MKLFLATSFSNKVDKDGMVTPDFREEIEAILRSYEHDGHFVFCAVREEGWKISGDDPVRAVQLDFSEIEASDIFVAILEEEVSAGVQLEIGYAMALKKPIELHVRRGAELGWTNQTLLAFDNVTKKDL